MLELFVRDEPIMSFQMSLPELKRKVVTTKSLELAEILAP